MCKRDSNVVFSVSRKKVILVCVCVCVGGENYVRNDGVIEVYK